MKPLLAYHSDPAIKEKYLARVRAHATADEIISGRYWENGKGCAVGCALHSSDHAAYEIELGIPQVLARFEVSLFERIFKHDPTFAKSWPERFLSAPKPGADLSMVWPRLAHWLLVDKAHGVIQFAKTEEERAAIQGVADLYRRWIGGDKPAREEWIQAENSADAAYAYAAAAASAAAAYAAYASTAIAYASAASASALENFYVLCAEKLLELMAAAPMEETMNQPNTARQPAEKPTPTEADKQAAIDIINQPLLAECEPGISPDEEQFRYEENEYLLDLRDRAAVIIAEHTARTVAEVKKERDALRAELAALRELVEKKDDALRDVSLKIHAAAHGRINFREDFAYRVDLALALTTTTQIRKGQP